jgi:ADP-ribose pyrophosphatase
MPKTRARKPAARILSSQVVYRGPVFYVATDYVIEPGGIKVRRDMVRHPGSVVVLAVNDSGREPLILLERQYRHSVKDFMWELPAGRIDEGESELAGAKRELREETGYSASKWKRIFKYYASPGFMDETMAVYLARGLKVGKAQPEEDEFIRHELIPLSRALKMVASGAIRDGKTLSAVLWLEWQRSRT